jgi:hypothetical protein
LGLAKRKPLPSLLPSQRPCQAKDLAKPKTLPSPGQAYARAALGLRSHTTSGTPFLHENQHESLSILQNWARTPMFHDRVSAERIGLVRESGLLTILSKTRYATGGARARPLLLVLKADKAKWPKEP